MNKFGHTISARTDRYKFIIPLRRREVIGLRNEVSVHSRKAFIYNLSADPGETNPVPLDEGPGHLIETANGLEVSPKEGPSLDGTMGEGVRQNLEDLGYVE